MNCACALLHGAVPEENSFTMKPSDDEKSRKQNLSLPNAQPDRKEEADYFITLGMAFAALLHRFNNTTGILGPSLVRLRMHFDDYIHGNKAALITVTGTLDVMEKVVRGTGELVSAVNALMKPIEPPAPLDINSLLYEVWEESCAIHTGKKVQTSFDFPECIPPVYGDSNLLAEVFRTVFENSLEAMDKETGYVSIRSRYVDSNQVVEVEVEDNGRGITPAILAGLFERPIRSLELSKGLGLWLAHLILARFGGNIRVKSTEVGCGTIIAITLPIAQTVGTPTK